MLDNWSLLYKRDIAGPYNQTAVTEPFEAVPFQLEGSTKVWDTSVWNYDELTADNQAETKSYFYCYFMTADPRIRRT